MSSGPGSLQNLILQKLRSNSECLLRKVLWEIAIEINGIQRLDPKWGVIENGNLKKSFVESFRRGVKSLEERHGIVLQERRRIGNYKELIRGSLFLTSNLAAHQLRATLAEDIINFIDAQVPKNLDKFDYDEDQVMMAHKANPDEHDWQTKEWTLIEREIVGKLPAWESEELDPWLNILNRGRYLYSGRQEICKVPLHRLLTLLKDTPTGQRPDAQGIVARLEGLVARISKDDRWKMGHLKSILYIFLNARIYEKVTIRANLKEYLFERHRQLLMKLPEHHEPTERPDHLTALRLGEKFYREREYSPLLDRLFDRQLFREQIFLRVRR